jgi:thiol-disulfide isomerase/thioredoxin
MKNIRKYAILLALSTVWISCNDAKKEDSAVVEQPTEKVEAAPKPMKVYTKDGVSINAYDFDRLEYFLKKQNDTTYVVNFWATWCVPCVEELPYFEKLNAEYKADKVKVLLVSLDMHKMIESKLIPFMKEKQLKSDVVLLRDPDADSWIPKVDSTWSGAIPATVIYNKDKRKFYEKSFTYAELESEIKNFK